MSVGEVNTYGDSVCQSGGENTKKIMSTVTTRMKQRLEPQGRAPFLLSLPFVLLFIVFSYLPLTGWVYSFFDYTVGLPLFSSPFVGFKYFTEMFRQWSQTSVVLRNTLVVSSIGVLMTPLPVIFAILLNEIRHIRVKRWIQTVTTLPNFISWIIVYGVAYSLFSLSGMVNTALQQAGFLSMPFNFLGDSDIAWFFQAMLSLWKGLGWSAIIYIAAISGIDQELYDAVKVDGGGRIRAITHVTIPGISSTYFVLLLLEISAMLSNGFDQYYVFNNPLVADKLMVLDLYVYNMGIVYGQYSFSVAIGIWKTLISIMLLVLANAAAKKVRGESVF